MFVVERRTPATRCKITAGAICCHPLDKMALWLLLYAFSTIWFMNPEQKNNQYLEKPREASSASWTLIKWQMWPTIICSSKKTYLVLTWFSARIFPYERWPLLHPPHRGVGRLSQSDLSCWMPHGRLFVKLLCSVCSLSPPSASWQRSHCEPEELRFVFPDALDTLWSGEGSRTHTHIHTKTHLSTHSLRASVDVPA